MKVSLTIFGIIGLLTLSVSAASAQRYRYHDDLSQYYMAKASEGHRGWQRVSIGFGIPIISGTTTYNYTQTDFNGDLGAKSTEGNVKLKTGLTINGGTFVPLMLLSEKLQLVINMEAMASLGLINTDSVTLENVDTKASIESPFIMLGLPVGMDIISGSHMSLNKNDRFMWGIGAGVNPALVYPTPSNDPAFAVIPYAKVELGFFAGVAFKLRGTAYFGSNKGSETNNYYSSTYDGNGNLTNIVSSQVVSNITYNYGFTLTLNVMLLSWGWSDFKY